MREDQAIDARKALATFVDELDKDGMPERSARRGGPTVDDLVQEYWQYDETRAEPIRRWSPTGTSTSTG